MPHYEERPDSAGLHASANSWLVGILIALVCTLFYKLYFGESARSVDYGNRVVTPRGDLAADEQSTIEVFEQSSPSVVFIRTKGFQRTLSGAGIERELSSGTGFVWDEAGHIVTNRHVIEGVLVRGVHRVLQVQFASNRVVDAEVIGVVHEHDLAVLKVDVETEELRPISLGTSSDLRVGQKVLAIGNPFGFDQTLSTGVIGGLNRVVATERQNEFLSGLIQTDAAINPGNSGGPLLDSAGRLIGVNTAIVSPTGAYSGLGFAVQVDAVVTSVTNLLEAARGDQPPDMLGATVMSRAEALRYGAFYGVPDEIINRGLIVSRVMPLSAAAEGGLSMGDQIVSFGGHPVSTLEDLRDAVQSFKAGDEAEIEIFRNDKRGSVTVKLRARKLFL